MDSIYIIILNWNGTQDTVACLKSLKNVMPRFRLVLVDNDSEIDEFTKLYEWCKYNYKLVGQYDQKVAKSGGLPDVETRLSQEQNSILIIRNDSNLGFAAGNNVALNYIMAKQNSESYVLLLNNDTVVEPDFLSHLVGFMEKNTDYVACTPQIRLFEPNNRIWNCGGRLLWVGNRKYYYANSDIKDVPQSGAKDVSYVTGCALFFKPNITGLLTEKFFFGEEDYEFSMRQKKRKHKMACVFDSVIFHKVHGSVVNISGNISMGKVYLFYLMRFIDNRTFYSRPMFVVQVVLNIMYAMFMIRLKYKKSIWSTIILFYNLLKELKRVDGVSKQRALELLNQ